MNFLETNLGCDCRSSEEARLGMAVGREMAAAAHGGAGQLSGVALASRVEEARGWLDCDGGCDS